MTLTTLPVRGRRDQQIGLPRQERRNLQDVDHLGRRRRLRRLVDVGEHRHAELGLHPLEDAQTLGQAGAAERADDVRLALSYDALKM